MDRITQEQVDAAEEVYRAAYKAGQEAEQQWRELRGQFYRQELAALGIVEMETVCIAQGFWGREDRGVVSVKPNGSIRFMPVTKSNRIAKNRNSFGIDFSKLKVEASA
jgi:hypothetical protein